MLFNHVRLQGDLDEEIPWGGLTVSEKSHLGPTSPKGQDRTQQSTVITQ